jgi:hypothetical protein
MSSPSDIDIESLIADFSRPLAPGDRTAFHDAAVSTLNSLPHLGEGSAHRALVLVQRSYLTPPDLSAGKDYSKYRR